jgi:glutathione S-transferase
MGRIISLRALPSTEQFGDQLAKIMSILCRSNDANRQGFERTMDEVNAALAQQPGPYFLDGFSLVDCVFAPFLERIGAHHQLYNV